MTLKLAPARLDQTLEAVQRFCYAINILQLIYLILSTATASQEESTVSPRGALPPMLQ